MIHVMKGSSHRYDVSTVSPLYNEYGIALARDSVSANLSAGAPSGGGSSTFGTAGTVGSVGSAGGTLGSVGSAGTFGSSGSCGALCSGY